MTSFLYPRVAQPMALAFLNDNVGLDPQRLREAASVRDWRPHYYAVGARVDDARLQRLANDVQAIAEELRYPDPLADRATFDRAAALRLLDEPILDVGAAGVWAHLGTAMMPHLTLWRWGWPSLPEGEDQLSARKAERFLGGFRNTFRRVWYRVWQFGPGEHHPPALFWEDAMVSIEERPSLGGNRRLATYIFWATRPWTARIHKGYREAAFREVAKDFTQIGAVTDFAAIGDEQLRSIVSEVVMRQVPEEHAASFGAHLAGEGPHLLNRTARTA